MILCRIRKYSPVFQAASTSVCITGFELLEPGPDTITLASFMSSKYIIVAAVALFCIVTF
jgi:hypothetical protein